MELLRALGTLCEAPAAGHGAIARALGLPAPHPVEWTRLFVLELPPYASIYVGAEGMIGGEARNRTAGFWRALGLVPPAEPDHLASLLGLYAALAQSEQKERDPARRALRRRARAALLWEHLASWLPPFLERLGTLAGEAYRAWARLLEQALAEEAAELGPLPAGLPAHLREAPTFALGADAGLDDLVGALLVPVRSGLVLTSADLSRTATELGLGRRLGRRPDVLRGLLAQDPAGMLRRLEAEARDRASRPAPEWAAGEIERFWRERAGAAAARLSELVRAAVRQEVPHAG
jgi:TorA maturation chaperone TorD